MTPVCFVIGSLDSNRAAGDVHLTSRSVGGSRRENHTIFSVSPQRGHNPLNGCPRPRIISSFHERKFSEEVSHEGLEGCGRMPGVAPGKLGKKICWPRIGSSSHGSLKGPARGKSLTSPLRWPQVGGKRGREAAWDHVETSRAPAALRGDLCLDVRRTLGSRLEGDSASEESIDHTEVSWDGNRR